MKDNEKELLPLVDEQGTVVGCATRGECHSGGKLLHPVVHLHVFNSRGELFLQKRPEWKDIQPGRWDTAVGGHVDYGETVEQALRREVGEELGISGFEPEFLMRYIFESERDKELVNVFRTTFDGDIRPTDELDGGRFWTFDEINAAIGRGVLTPNFEQEFRKIERITKRKEEPMTLQEAVAARHSVRRYVERPLEEEAVAALRAKVDEVNAEGNLHVQLVLNEPKAFRGVFAYGKFSGVGNYLVMAGRKAADLDERVGYYGEKLVLLAQTLGLNTCWAGLSYTRVAGTYELREGEKIACYIALGYGATQGVSRKSKSVADVSNASEETPEWFHRGVEAALLAPTAINQQKFRFEYLGGNRVGARRGFSMVGYTQMDLGIAKLHFEIGAQREILWE